MISIPLEKKDGEGQFEKEEEWKSERMRSHQFSTGSAQCRVNIIILITFSISFNPHNQMVMEHETEN